MEKKPLYTIGHGVRKAEVFLELLKRYGIECLVDVRSVPYSRFNPQYRQAELTGFLEENGITYVFMGDTLGGRPKDPACYNENGIVDYDLIRSKEFFREGIDRLKEAYSDKITIAIMCSESKPLGCHRTHLIADVLDAEGIHVVHIDEKGELRPHGLLVESRRGLFGEL